ncbi:MAG: hypothetical protein F9K45_11145, partial [Melioribacteraceae bacterium]
MADVNFSLNVFPNIGGTATEFKFNVKEISGYGFDALNYTVKIDFDQDGTYETELKNSASVNHVFSNNGKKIINGIIKIGNSEFSFSNTIFIVEPQLLLAGQQRFIYEPQIYNTPKIIFTWGGDDANGNHALHMMDYDGSNRTCIFCGVEGIDIAEMHCGLLSPDGRKLIWDSTGDIVGYDFFNSNGDAYFIYDSKYYEHGKIFWSLSGDKLFMIDNDSEGVFYLPNNGSGMKRNVVDYGEFISPVPDQDLQIAVLTESPESTQDSIKGDLKIFSIASSSVVKEYKNLPAFGSFRVINGGRKLFFEKPMIIYDLEKNKANYLWFDEIPFAQHSEGDSDITIEGDKIIFSVFHNDYDKRNLYMFNIPIN